MKMPQSPPDTKAIWNEYFQQLKNSPDTQPFWTSVSGPTYRGEYLHWDKLRHLSAPEGISHEQWWAALKLHRKALSKPVPLRDDKGVPFSFGLPDPAPELLHDIDQGGGGMIAVPEQVLNPEVRDRYVVNSLMEEAIRSSQLEGAVTTREIAREMIRSGREPGDRSERMILNNFTTMQRVRQLCKEALTPDTVFELHRIVTDGTLNDATAAGRLRHVNEPVQVVNQDEDVLHDPPAADQLTRRMDEMCAFANGQIPLGVFIHPVVRGIILHFWLAYDHPFVDGNGRTARALFYWSMLRHKYWLFEYTSISRTILEAPAQYGRAFLYTETDENDLTYFVLYHLEVIRKAIEELHIYLRRKTEEVQALDRRLRTTVDLNHRQRALLAHAMRHPEARYTIESQRISHQVAYQTARTDLLDLAGRGLLHQTRVGKTLYFRPVEDLQARLIKLK